MATSAIGKKRGRPKSKVRGAAAPKAKAKPKVAAAPKKKPAAAVGKTMTAGGKRYTKSSCFATKDAAQDAAKKIRTGGKLARVVERCVFVRNKG